MNIEKDLFQQFIEKVPIGILVQCDGKVVFINKTLKEMLGITSLHSLQLRDIIPPESRKELLQIYRTILKNHSDKRELRIKTLSGKILWVEVITEEINLDGKRCSISGLIDITDKKNLERQLRKLATIDRLTGIYNRYAFEKFLEEEISRAERYGTDFALIMFDIDNFKKINDTYGHQTGDMILRKITRLVKENIRKSDIFGRWGGEEFMIILPVKSIEEAFKVAEKLRKKIEEHKFPKVKKVTISAGVTMYRKSDTLKSIIRRVDTALYMAKKSGKNKVVTA